MRTKTSVVLFPGILLLCASGAWAQEVNTSAPGPVGGPQPGVEVQYRYTNPGDSQQILNAAPATGTGDAAGGVAEPRRGVSAADYLRQRSAQRAAAAAAAEDGGAEGDGAETDEAFVNNMLVGVSAAGGLGGGMIVGATIYTGITPNFTDTLPHVSRLERRAEAGGANALTWIGFQPFPDSTRVFVQTGRPTQPQLIMAPDGRTLTMRFENTTVGLSNFTRDIDATYFDRTVTHIRGRRVGSATEVTIELDGTVDYQLVSDENNPDYVYIDFAHTPQVP
jgi:hypothetical protein